MNRRKVEEAIIKGFCIAAAFLASALLFFIISTIFIKALPSLTLPFLLTPESATEGIGQGLLNAIIGTVILSICATVVAIPLAFGTAIYLQRYAFDNPITRALRFFIEVLSGTPSIVLGMFGFLIFVYYMKWITGGFSLISGSIALAILIMPVIERSIEQAIESVDHSLEEGSYGLGANKWQTIRFITLPAASSGILTGLILGFGRAAEESAIVILTAGYTQHMPEFALKSNPNLFMGVKIYPFQDLVATLPYSVYHAYENSNLIPLSNGFAAAFVLISVVLAINLSAKTIFWYSTRSTRTPSPILTSLTRSLFNGNGRPSRTKPVPAPACAAAELAGIEQEPAVRVQASTPQNTRLTPSPISRTSELDWRETLTAGLQASTVAGSGSRDLSVPSNDDSIVIPGEGSPLPSNPGGDTLDPDEELRIEEHFDDDALFEDDPVLLHDSAGNDLESAFTLDYPLLEEDPASLIIESPSDEPWRRMTRNRLENTIAGITADPWEGP